MLMYSYISRVGTGLFRPTQADVTAPLATRASDPAIGVVVVPDGREIIRAPEPAHLG
jgi:hypothetical protein